MLQHHEGDDSFQFKTSKIVYGISQLGFIPLFARFRRSLPFGVHGLT